MAANKAKGSAAPGANNKPKEPVYTNPSKVAYPTMDAPIIENENLKGKYISDKGAGRAELGKFFDSYFLKNS